MDAREPTTLTARVADGLESVSREAWNRLAASGNGPLRYRYLRAWERGCDLQGLTSRPVLAYEPEGREPLAACPGYLYDLDVATVRFPALAGLVHGARRALPRLGMSRTYELGSPTPLTNPLLVADPDLRPAAVAALIAAALERSDDAEFVLVQNFTSLDTPAGAELARRGFVGIPMPATALLDLPYSSFDEYLSAMRSPYRRRARQALTRSRHLSVEHIDEFGHLADELARLWHAVYDRAGEVKREVLTADYFRLVAEIEDVSVLVTRRGDGSIASFALLMADAPWLTFLQCGFELEAGRDEGAYFRLLYEIARHGIEHDFEQVELGMTTLAPKFDIGAIPIGLFAWIKHHNPLFQRAMPFMARRMTDSAAAEPRRVFKHPTPEAEELLSRRSVLR